MIPGRKTVTWVLVADGVGAQIFTLTAPPLHLEPVANGTFRGVSAMTRDLESDRPGTSFESVGGARHAIQRRTDAHRHQKELFSGRVATAVNAAARTKAFQELIVVAPPRALGDLREALDNPVHNMIKLEIPGEWTKLSPTEIIEHLRPHLALPESA